jgi:hypothetical protein
MWTSTSSLRNPRRTSSKFGGSIEVWHSLSTHLTPQGLTLEQMEMGAIELGGFAVFTALQSCAAQNFSAQENLELLRPVKFNETILLCAGLRDSE